MNTLTRHTFALSLILVFLGIHATAQRQTKPVKKAPTGTVSGKVTIKGKGAPGVVVAIRQIDFGPQPPPSFKAITDQDGNYRITDVPAGNHQISPIAPAFVLSDLSNPGLINYGRGMGKGLVLAANERVEGVDFSLARGGVITGKVTDADGRPLIEEHINISPAAPTNEQASYAISSTGFQTDDRGIYRIFGVPAGRYTVAVGQPENDFYRTMFGGRPSYKQTFHPDVSDPAKATLIEVTEGLEVTNVDISVGRVRQTFAASGRVVDSGTDQPVPNVGFGIRMLGEERGTTGTNATSNGQGEFRIENLTPGKYEVLVMPFQGADFLSDPVSFEILDQNVTGLLLKASIGASVSGKVFLEGTDDKSVFTRLAELRLQVYVQSEKPSSGFGQFSEIGPDGSFRAGGLSPGIAVFYLGGPDRALLKGFVISRVERDGSVQPRGLEIKSGEQISGVHVVISYGSEMIRGTVKLENGTLPPGSRIGVRLTKQGENLTNSGMGGQFVDSRGHFLIEGIAAGSYELMAFANVQGPPNKQPSAKQQINVVEGTVTEVTITLDLKPDANLNPKP